jgi:hypothetical protein
VYGKELKLNKDKIIKLNKEFYGIVDDNEPEYIESDLGDMIINPKYNRENELNKAEAKLKQYEEEHNKIQIDEIKEFKPKIFNVLKCNLDYGNDEKLKELKVKLNQCEETYKINLSKLKASNDNKYIRDCNYYSLKIAKLKGIIKLKSELTDDDEIVINKKSVAAKVNENRTKDYYIDRIE